jgi:hypothetical protein
MTMAYMAIQLVRRLGLVAAWLTNVRSLSALKLDIHTRLGSITKVPARECKVFVFGLS